MAEIKCPECGELVSDEDSRCATCGAALVVHAFDPDQVVVSARGWSASGRLSPTALVIAVVLLIAVLFLAW